MSVKSIPMYQFIIDDIKAKIKNGELELDQPLPNQIELAKMYNTSEITSRRALTELVKEGYIYRIRGKGSFIKEEDSNEKNSTIRTVYFVYNDLSVDAFNHRYWSDMLEMMKEVCDENGVNFYLWASGEVYTLPDDPHGAFVLVIPPLLFDQRKLEVWRDEGKRIVTVQFYYPHLSIPYVIADNLTGGYLATQHLLSLGHKRTGIILTGKSLLDLNQEFSLRLQGYRLALQQHHIPFDPELVCVMEGSKENMDMGYEGFKQLHNHTDNPPTAIFVTSDLKAMGALKAAQDMGLKVPEDISLVGYDDLRISSFTYPHLTTINQNTTQIGRRAIEILLHELPKNRTHLVKDEIVPKLIIRGTTSALDK
ncbi:substrate-binding domain-containing protein [Cohnella sp. WQ 127256]|uniref:GntR family transcriptional regulator n=1 Tax=Cohnella sp. WQ 127256 TaxID=2938790 RepID=UPI0021176F89|nr:substrate-binding domain-containing protein [Cohnella sp. WQ 127256]